jgi:hypothetical protein
MGRIAGQMASTAVDAPGTRVRSVLLQPELVVRESTAAPPALRSLAALSGQRRTTPP